jgi:hypothetical protein
LASTSTGPSTALTAGPGGITGSQARGSSAPSTTRLERSSGNTRNPRGSSSAGILTTVTDLAITGDAAGNLLAVRTSDGTIVGHENIGRMGGAPATVELDGKQYLLVTGGNSLFAYALP